MDNSHPISLGSTIQNYSSRSIRRMMLSGMATLTIPPAALADSVAGSGAETSVLFIVAFALATIAVSVLLIVGLTRWGHKQDQIENMMSFCIKYLVESKNEHEKREAASALGEAQDPDALLILINIADDDDADEGLRRTAGEALQTMSRNYRQYSSMIIDCLKAVEEKDHKRLIDLLLETFENEKRKYAQSAYLIGREYMRMEQYPDARIWLEHARIRNKKSRVYISQISHLIVVCNQHLFIEGDMLLRSGDYRDALDLYALGSHNLNLEDKKRYSVHIRLACAYCKLHHYDDAYQETLLSLQDQETEETLVLNKLLQEIRKIRRKTGDLAQARLESFAAEVDSHVDRAMAELT